MQDVKDVLEYTEDELRALPKLDLQILLHEAEYKESLFNTRQLVEKTLMNKIYGALANRWFPLFNEDIAAAITGNGRYFIRKLAIYIEEALQKMFTSEKQYIVAGDTDSLYYHIEPFMLMYQEKHPNLSISEYVDWADAFEKKVIQPVINKCISDFAAELNAYNTDMIKSEREIIADVAVFCAKKKYFARVRDKEGTRYPENNPKIKMTGLEIIKSGTPVWSKKQLKKVIPIILDNNEQDIRDWLQKIKWDFTSQPLNDIAAVAGVSSLDYQLGEKGVPMGVRSALVFNKYIKENNLQDKYQPIQPGDKTKRLFLVLPNKFNTDVIGYTNDLFTKELEGCIDFDKNFEKNFLAPLDLMVNTLKYNLQKETEDLDDW